MCALTIITAALTASFTAADDLGVREAHVWETVEYALSNATWDGNPFDVVAKVRFVHEDEVRTTEMFYTGDNRWQFRFTGTREGLWQFITSSDDPDLDGHTGRITVLPRENEQAKGFLTGVGNKYAIMTSDVDHVEGYVYNVFMNQQDYEQQYRHPSRILGAPDRRELIADYWDSTVDNGFNTYFFAVFYSWFRMGALSIDDFDGASDPALQTPDLALFETLERAIQHAHAQGGRTHIWAWGDNDRKQTPNHLPGGLHGEAHRRLIRYIAARLGPLPGLSMNFGFDTIEMPDAEEGAAWWADRTNSTMGWPHILTSRGWDHPSFGAHSYAGFGGNPYDLETSDKGPASYDEIRAHLAARTDKPHIYEERHTYKRWRCWPHPVAEPARLDEVGTRRLIWWEAMAGGMGGFFGHFSERFNAYGPFKPEGPCGYHPESLKRAFRTHGAFWADGRLRLDMAPVDGRIEGAKGYALATPERKHFIFYVENAEEAELDLHDMAGARTGILVSTTDDYAEIDLGILAPGKQRVTLPHAGDWAIAIGHFGE